MMPPNLAAALTHWYVSWVLLSDGGPVGALHRNSSASSLRQRPSSSIRSRHSLCTHASRAHVLPVWRLRGGGGTAGREVSKRLEGLQRAVGA